VNGLTSPPHVFQVASWVLFALFLAGFYCLPLPYAPFEGRLAGGLVFALAALATAAAAASATSINPADECIFVEDGAADAAGAAGAAGAGAHVRSRSRELRPGHLFCYRCECQVKETSKHCTVCNKCVDVFDHHCVWLNNCVGRRNYVPFVALLASAASMLAVPVAFAVYVLADFARAPAAVDARVRGFYPSLGGAAFLALVLVLGTLALATLAGVAQLLLFHVFLVRRGLTTYDYIMGRIARERAANDAAEALAAARARGDAAGVAAAAAAAAAAAVEEPGKGSAMSAAVADIRARHAAGLAVGVVERVVLFLAGGGGGGGAAGASTAAAGGTAAATADAGTFTAVADAGSSASPPPQRAEAAGFAVSSADGQSSAFAGAGSVHVRGGASTPASGASAGVGSDAGVGAGAGASASASAGVGAGGSSVASADAPSSSPAPELADPLSDRKARVVSLRSLPLSGEAVRDGGGGGGGDSAEGKRAGDEAGAGPLASLQAAAGLLESPVQRPLLDDAAGVIGSRSASAGAASVTASLTGVTVEEKERGFGSKDDDEDSRSEVDAEVRVSVDESAKA